MRGNRNDFTLGYGLWSMGYGGSAHQLPNSILVKCCKMYLQHFTYFVVKVDKGYDNTALLFVQFVCTYQTYGPGYTVIDLIEVVLILP
jgi:hypothetical protein